MRPALRLARVLCILTAVLLTLVGLLSLIAAILSLLGLRQSLAGQTHAALGAGIMFVLAALPGWLAILSRGKRGNHLALIYGIFLICAGGGIPFVLGLDLFLTGMLFFLSAAGLWIIVVYRSLPEETA